MAAINNLKNHLIILILMMLFVIITKAQYDDVRCKCVCLPKHPLDNSTNTTRKIFVKSFHEPSFCKCENVVPEKLQSDNFCVKCDCQWQRRNTATIKVVVIFIVCVVSLLVMYMIFLLCLDPLLNKQMRANYEQQEDTISTSDAINSRLSQVFSQSDKGSSSRSTSRQRPGVITRVKEEMKKVQGEQERWKDTVDEQRQHIYVKHTMLN
ncbi:hypothetical protein HELRODRAFT_191505 [Helobdella robusta]|uniref:Transmembrane protein 9 n=1 Tax=Helobdella robusta TaxID=6412 RepID=T1FT19_HELRO|nr:hypothetical protein HELRODRAFT_191505 [Helobdella robusta]ESO04896.1 hypothetical protein HELRODRAFT_191505 [Helobdella robusta]